MVLMNDEVSQKLLELEISVNELKKNRENDAALLQTQATLINDITLTVKKKEETIKELQLKLIETSKESALSFNDVDKTHENFVKKQEKYFKDLAEKEENNFKTNSEQLKNLQKHFESECAEMYTQQESQIRKYMETLNTFSNQLNENKSMTDRLIMRQTEYDTIQLKNKTELENSNYGLTNLKNKVEIEVITLTNLKKKVKEIEDITLDNRLLLEIQSEVENDRSVFTNSHKEHVEALSNHDIILKEIQSQMENDRSVFTNNHKEQVEALSSNHKEHVEALSNHDIILKEIQFQMENDRSVFTNNHKEQVEALSIVEQKQLSDEENTQITLSKHYESIKEIEQKEFENASFSKNLEKKVEENQIIIAEMVKEQVGGAEMKTQNLEKKIEKSLLDLIADNSGKITDLKLQQDTDKLSFKEKATELDSSIQKIEDSIKNQVLQKIFDLQSQANKSTDLGDTLKTCFTNTSKIVMKNQEILQNHDKTIKEHAEYADYAITLEKHKTEIESNKTAMEEKLMEIDSRINVKLAENTDELATLTTSTFQSFEGLSPTLESLKSNQTKHLQAITENSSALIDLRAKEEKRETKILDIIKDVKIFESKVNERQKDFKNEFHLQTTKIKEIEHITKESLNNMDISIGDLEGRQEVDHKLLLSQMEKCELIEDENDNQAESINELLSLVETHLLVKSY